jgi:phage terminase large subunit
VAVELDKFQYRDYQEEILYAIEEQKYRKILAILPRRAGKDITAWNICIRQCIKKRCLVMYVLPKYGQARSTVFDAISSEGIPFLEYIPKEVVYKINISEMKVQFHNGSILKLVGGDTHDSSIRGTNPYMVVLSEYAYFKDGVAVYDTISPILAANGGIVVFISTVFGKNFMWHMYNIAKDQKDWFVMYKKTSELKHIPEEALEAERIRMSPAKYAQEYENDWNQGVEGSYFGVELVRLEQEGQLTLVPHDPMLVTYVACDIGVKDATTLIFFQVMGEGVAIRIIDCYSNNNLGLDHYVKIIQDKPYRYSQNSFFAPHDMMVREWGGGAITRYEKGRQLGINFTVLEQIDFMDGIDNVRMTFPRLWIDKNKCKSLIDAIENYRREFDEEKQVYSNKPIHNWASHYVDSLRYLCQSLPKTKTGMTASDFEAQRMRALYGDNNNLPNQLRPNDDYRR